MKEDQPSILGIALIICRNPLTGKYLAVYEKNKTWWVPGGRVDAPESFSDGARRECIEEAGINVELKGILRIEQSGGGYNMNRLKSKDHLSQSFIIVNQLIPIKYPSKSQINNP